MGVGCVGWWLLFPSMWSLWLPLLLPATAVLPWLPLCPLSAAALYYLCVIYVFLSHLALHTYGCEWVKRIGNEPQRLHTAEVGGCDYFTSAPKGKG